MRGVRLGRSVELAFQADTWTEPAAAERIYDDEASWNLRAEVDARLGGRWGISAKLGGKSGGFLPGAPADRGPYAGFGITAAW